MKGARIKLWIGAALLLISLLLCCASAGAEEDGLASLVLPALTETECEWDANGNLVSETAHDLNGQPALNRRGFYRALYTYDQDGNMLTAAYYDLAGQLVTTDTGYARAVFTYMRDSEGASHVLTEDRYQPDGSRAQIPHSYSYRRDTWSGDDILSSEYFDAEGKLTRPSGG